jgi:hypothetical protein
MTAIKLFNLDGGSAIEILGSATALEKSLQHLIEQNLEPLLGIRFLGSEYSTGPKHGGRIDTLGIDENAGPVIIEYKVAWRPSGHASGQGSARCARSTPLPSKIIKRTPSRARRSFSKSSSMFCSLPHSHSATKARQPIRRFSRI